jgi:hypothetical protein
MLPWALLIAVAPTGLDFNVNTLTGLFVSVDGVPVVRGTWFQYYEAGWTKGYYSSQYNQQVVTRPDADTLVMTYKAPDGLAFGTQTYKKNGRKLSVTYRFEWAGPKPAKVEATAGMLWAPALETYALTVDGKPARGLERDSYVAGDMGSRRYAENATSFLFESTGNQATIRSSRPIGMFDARGYGQDWANKRELYWMGAEDMNVSKEKPLEFTVDWDFTDFRTADSTPVAKTLALGSGAKEARAVRPFERIPDLIPKPKLSQLDFKKTIELTENYTYPVGKFRFLPDLGAALRRRFQTIPKGGKPIAIDGGTAKIGLRPGGYRLVIQPGSVSVIGQDLEGLQSGIERLAAVAFVQNGKLVWPTGVLLDEPRQDFRGVHLFVGPKSVEFQKKLWTRVLRPLGFNKVVLQCEQTEWKSAPGIKSALSMEPVELARLFKMYRGIGVEPIPLIQSFGHTEWLFRNGKNLDLAFNKDVPYAIDPRKPAAGEMISNIWDEAIDLLKPERIHFGLDEVDMRGFPDGPQLTTELWKLQVPFLAKIAEKHKLPMMMWGDKGLAPGEAPDAALGDNAVEAQARRNAIPKGTFITDWHYAGNPNPEVFIPVLDLWKREGMKPIAATWFNPNNIRGFSLAADAMGAGTLQTTWAGYESNEAAMLAALPQFTAMVLAADYSWSARTEMVDKLPYNPEAVFRRMYFAAPQSLKSLPGQTFGTGQSFTVGTVAFREIVGLQAAGGMRGTSTAAEVVLQGSGSTLALALSGEIQADAGEELATVELTLGNGKTVKQNLVYGRDFRSMLDKGSCFASERENGRSVAEIKLPKGSRVTKLLVTPLKPYSSVFIHGITLW